MKTKANKIFCVILSVFTALSSISAFAADGEITNVALQYVNGVNTVTVTADHKASDSVPAAVFDGKSGDASGTNKWYTAADIANGAWINVDLNSVCQISSIKVYSGYGNTASTSDRLLSYDIYYSEGEISDPSSDKGYTLLKSVEADNGLYEINFETVSARNVKLVSKNTTAFRLREVEIFGFLGEGAADIEKNVALNKQNVQGSFSRSDAGSVKAVTDGIKDQSGGDYKYFVAKNYSNGAWVNIDLEEEFLISKVIVYSGYADTSANDLLTDFDICCTDAEVSDPASAKYITVYSAKGAAARAEIVLRKPVVARNVKILSKVSNDAQFRIREIEVMGRKAPEMPAVTLLSPQDGSGVGIGKPIELSAQVTIQQTAISKVTFYVDGQPLEKTPDVNGDIYTVQSDALSEGRHTIKVTAENTAGGIGESAEITVYAADYRIESAEFRNGAGEPIVILPAEDDITATVKLASFKDEALDNAAAIMGLYNINTGILEAASCQTFALAANGTQTVTAGIDQLPSDIENYCVKIFFWKGTDNIMPICEPIFLGYTKPNAGAVTLNQSEYKNYEDIICSVNAFDDNADIAKVEFFVNGEADKNNVTEKSGIYTVNLGSRQSGEYSVYARVTNSLGVSVNSEPVSFTVTGYNYDANEIILQVVQNGFDVYVKGSMSDSAAYAKYHFEHIVRGDINADLYRVYQTYAAVRTEDLSFQPMFGGGALTGVGELECALNEVGAADYVGGFHGDEHLTQVSLALDGETIDLNKEGYYKGRSLVFTQDSVINRCDTPDDNIVNHTKKYTVTKDGMTIEQDIEWLAAVELDHGYTAMLPVNRVAGDRQLTHKIQVIEPLDSTVYDVPKKDAVTSAIALTKKQKNGVRKVKTWGEESGIEVTLESIPDEVMPNSFFILMVRDGDNKLYFDYSGEHTTAVGEKWHNVSKYQINLSR